MPRHAPELECSPADRASLVGLTKNRTAEARIVERARIILACLEGKEIQQVARELRVSIPSVSKWRQRFSLWGLRGLRDRLRPGKPVKYDTAFRNGGLDILEENSGVIFEPLSVPQPVTMSSQIMIAHGGVHIPYHSGVTS